MDAITLEATLETRQSKEGKDYQVIVINLTPTYQKLVFLDRAELELIKNTSKSDNFGY